MGVIQYSRPIFFVKELFAGRVGSCRIQSVSFRGSRRTVSSTYLCTGVDDPFLTLYAGIYSILPQSLAPSLWHTSLKNWSRFFGMINKCGHSPN